MQAGKYVSTTEPGSPHQFRGKPEHFIRKIDEFGPQTDKVLEVKKQLKKGLITLKVTGKDSKEAL